MKPTQIAQASPGCIQDPLLDGMPQRERRRKRRPTDRGDGKGHPGTVDRTAKKGTFQTVEKRTIRIGVDGGLKESGPGKVGIAE